MPRPQRLWLQRLRLQRLRYGCKGYDCKGYGYEGYNCENSEGAAATVKSDGNGDNAAIAILLTKLLVE
jgi:hypothetical protein